MPLTKITAKQINYNRGNASSVTRIASDKLKETVSILDFGAHSTTEAGYSSFDSTAAIQAAINSLSSSGGFVFFPPGNYKTTATITLSNENVSLAGSGSSQMSVLTAGSVGVIGVGRHSGSTIITGSFNTGSVIKVANAGCSISDMTIDASDARRTSGITTSHGIQVEAADAAGAATTRIKIDRVRATNQPGCGVVLINNIVSSSLSTIEVDHNAKHGIAIVGGSYTSRTNRSRPGQIDISDCRAGRNGGHGLCVGGMSENDIYDTPYRIKVENFDGFYNCITSSVCVDPANPSNCYISGENIDVFRSAFDGLSEFPSIADTHTTIQIRGRNIGIINYRAISGNPYAIKLVGHPYFASSMSKGIWLHRLYITNTIGPVGFYDPAIYWGSDVNGIDVSVDYVDTKTTNISSRKNGTHYTEHSDLFSLSDISPTFNQITANSVTAPYFRSYGGEVSINDDTSKYLEFSAPTRGVFTFSGSSAFAKGGVVHFRTGDASAFVVVMANSGGNVDGVVGALTGTTGTDTHVTVGVSTTLNRLYLENRTATARMYTYTLSPLSGSPTVTPFA